MPGRQEIYEAIVKICQDSDVQTRPNMKERVKALREEAILDAAQELIQSKGYAAMTLDDITELVGISKPTLYLHFKSKEDIAAHISRRCIQQALDVVLEQDHDLPAADRIRDFVRWSIDRRFGADSVLFQDLVKHILPGKDEASPAYEVEVAMVTAVVELLAKAQAEGGVRSDIPAAMLGALLLGFVKNWRVDELVRSSELTVPEITESWMILLSSNS